MQCSSVGVPRGPLDFFCDDSCRILIETATPREERRDISAEYTCLDSMMDTMEVMALWPSDSSSFFHSSWQIYNSMLSCPCSTHMMTWSDVDSGKNGISLRTTIGQYIQILVPRCIFNPSHTEQQQYHLSIGRELSNGRTGYYKSYAKLHPWIPNWKALWLFLRLHMISLPFFPNCKSDFDHWLHTG